jgi:hypothetical protein
MVLDVVLIEKLRSEMQEHIIVLTEQQLVWEAITQEYKRVENNV